MPLSTRAVEKLLGVSYTQLHYLINTDRMAPPQKNISGGYEWTDEDVERARTALALWRGQRLSRLEAGACGPTTNL
jgi:hypothetical protein